ncbi:metal-sensitive transcriptional regulator [Cryobacterium sp. N21]|uniref:metal-sensitive transcriptional regulator n=1 Tax=Cryobacterium sp. N21 TaxID=2048289 RepID=UPI000CE483AF|nr:metal-sensitive transcriptional regulator [Cryobacterium sp. N21]
MSPCPTSRHDAANHGYITDKNSYRNRLRRFEGQVRGIDRMIDKERYCINILTQISAITKAVDSVALGLLDDGLRQCVLDAAAAGQQVSEVTMAEASDAIARLVRS